MRREAREGMRAQARVGGKLVVLGKPLREGTGAHAHAETLVDRAVPRAAASRHGSRDRDSPGSP